MKTKELLKILKKHGVTFVRSGGNHDIYYSPLTNKKLKIWRHAKEVPTRNSKPNFEGRRA